MNNRLLSLLLVASMLTLAQIASRAEATPTAAELAAHMDKVRRPSKSFSVRVKLTEIRDGETGRVAEFDVYARKVSGYPDFDTLTRCVTPEDDAGKILLTKGSDAWLYDPKSKRPISVSYEKMRSKFFVSYGLTSSFVQEYDAEYGGIETIPDVAKKDRVCHRLHLIHRGGSRIAPGSLDYWVDVANLRPVRGKIMSTSGKVLRTAYYTRFQEVLGELRPTRLPIVSGVERGLVTDVDFSGFAYRDFDAKWFASESMADVSKGLGP
jgi:outer membrane lipoprotein-sorting protein